MLSGVVGWCLALETNNSYLGSSVSSTEIDIKLATNLRHGHQSESLSIKWKSDLIDKINCSFFKATDVSILLYGCTTWTLTKRMEKRQY